MKSVEISRSEEEYFDCPYCGILNQEYTGFDDDIVECVGCHKKVKIER